jgi:hypothetical protein
MTKPSKQLVAAGVALALGAWLAGGCDSGSPATGQAVPPIIEADPADPHSAAIGSIVWLDADPSPREWEFAIVVIEEDVARPLEARWRLVTRAESTPAYTRLPALEGGQRVRPLRIKVSTSQLTPDCQRLELAVSGSFFRHTASDLDDRFGFDVTERGKERDLALATWWIWRGLGNEASAEQKARLLDRCDDIENRRAQ